MSLEDRTKERKGPKGKEGARVEERDTEKDGQERDRVWEKEKRTKGKRK